MKNSTKSLKRKRKKGAKERRREMELKKRLLKLVIRSNMCAYPFFPTTNEIAREVGVSWNTAERHLRELAKNGFVIPLYDEAGKSDSNQNLSRSHAWTIREAMEEMDESIRKMEREMGKMKSAKR